MADQEEPGLSLWAVYLKPEVVLPSDRYVAVRVSGGEVTSDMIVAQSLDRLRELLPRGLIRLERDPEDDPSIVEIWI